MWPTSWDNIFRLMEGSANVSDVTIWTEPNLVGRAHVDFARVRSSQCCCGC